MKERPILFSGPMVRAILDNRKTMTRRVVKVAYTYDYTAPRGEKQKSTGVNGYIGHHINHPRLQDGLAVVDQDGDRLSESEFMEFCPYGQPGDRLWVRETCYILGTWVEDGKNRSGRKRWRFRASDQKRVRYQDAPPTLLLSKGGGFGWVKRPSIHMPRWASRILLEVTEVRVERVQDISEADAMHEGIVECDIPATGDYPDMVGYMVGPDDGRELFDVSPKDSFRKLWDSINEARGYGRDANPWVWVVSFKRIEVKP
jgi:hypothetical protein